MLSAFREVGSGSASPLSKRKRDASPHRKMRKVKRDIPVYSTVIKGSTSGLSLVNPKGGVSSSTLVSTPVIRGNHLLGQYEQECRHLSGDLELERRLLMEEK